MIVIIRVGHTKNGGRKNKTNDYWLKIDDLKIYKY